MSLGQLQHVIGEIGSKSQIFQILENSFPHI